MRRKKEWTFRELFAEGEKRLKEALIEEAGVDSHYLLEFVTELSLAEFFLRAEEGIEEDEKVQEFFALIDRRTKRIPLSYLTGRRGFMGLDFYVNENVLIPEQDTEILVEEVLKFSKGKKILDLCTGSGCIAISLLSLGEVGSIVASDISNEALLVAEKNLNLVSENERKKIKLIQGDLFERIEGRFDIIVSNPPYIESKMIDGLQPEVSVYEPRLALDGSEDGLLFYRRIAKEAKDYFGENGILFLEIGSSQAEAVKKILQEERFHNIRVLKDLAHLDRVVVAEL